MEPNDSNPLIEPTSMKPSATIARYGLIGGLIIVVYSLVGMLTGLASPTSMVSSMIFSVLAIVIYIGVMVFAVREDRRENMGGFISFGRAFGVAFGTALFMGVIGLIFNVIYLGFIDPDYMVRMGDDLAAMYEQLGMSEEQIEAALQQAGATGDATIGTILSNQAIGFGMGLVLSVIISLIVAAVMKKDRPRTMALDD